MGQAATVQARDTARIQDWIRGRHVNPPWKKPRPRPPAWVRIEFIDGHAVVNEDLNAKRGSIST